MAVFAAIGSQGLVLRGHIVADGIIGKPLHPGGVRFRGQGPVIGKGIYPAAGMKLRGKGGKAFVVLKGSGQGGEHEDHILGPVEIIGRFSVAHLVFALRVGLFHL